MIIIWTQSSLISLMDWCFDMIQQQCANMVKTGIIATTNYIAPIITYNIYSIYIYTNNCWCEVWNNYHVIFHTIFMTTNLNQDPSYSYYTNDDHHTFSNSLKSWSPFVPTRRFHHWTSCVDLSAPAPVAHRRCWGAQGEPQQPGGWTRLMKVGSIAPG